MCYVCSGQTFLNGVVGKATISGICSYQYSGGVDMVSGLEWLKQVSSNVFSVIGTLFFKYFVIVSGTLLLQIAHITVNCQHLVIINFSCFSCFNSLIITINWHINRIATGGRSRGSWSGRKYFIK